MVQSRKVVARGSRAFLICLCVTILAKLYISTDVLNIEHPKAVMAGLVIGIGFIILFSVTTTCAGFVQRPTMKLLVAQSQYIGIGGSIWTKCFHGDGSFTVPEERINLTRGAEISLVAWRYSQPDSLELRAESLTNYGDEDFVYYLRKSDDSSKYIVDVPADDYALVVKAEWDDESLPVSRSIYYFRLFVS